MPAVREGGGGEARGGGRRKVHEDLVHFHTQSPVNMCIPVM